MDQLSNNNPTEYDFLKTLLDSPEFVHGSKEEFKVEDMPKSAFAHPFAKEFPMDTAENTYNSKVYLEAYSHSMPGNLVELVHDGLSKAATYHGIAETFAVIESKADVAIKSASTKVEEKYALEYEDDNGDICAVYPINDAEDVIDAGYKLANDRHKMTVDWFRDAATNVMKAASAHGVHDRFMPSIVKNVGIEREFNEKTAAYGLEQRINLVKERAWQADADLDDSIVELYTDAFTMAKESATEDDRKEILDLISDLDNTYGVDYNHVADPYAAFYSGMKTASFHKEVSNYVFIGDAHIPVQALNQLSESRISEEFPKEAAATITAALENAMTGDMLKVAKATEALQSLESVDKADLLHLILDVAA